MISPETVQQIIQTADVVEVIGDYVALKKRGANMIACCPFHHEKTPSFSVSPTKQIYKCFGCGKAGDAVRFVMDIEGISYPDALRWLAKKYGIRIEEKVFTDEQLAAQNERESLFLALNFAKDFYIRQLWETEEGKSIGLSYFKERGFSHPTLQSFELGYSPESGDALTQEALAKGYSLDVLEKAGLTLVKEGRKPIDRFRGRVIFPIHQISGRPIAFGARILRKDPQAPKYLNSPETPVYHKSQVLYGIYQAKNAIRQQDVCYLVEGYTDVVSLYQGGIENVVASSGTSLTREQIQLIRRFTPHITVLYDGDPAGIRASLRGIDLILEEGMHVRAVVFPEGEDPDSFIQRVGSEGFRKFVTENQKDFIRFKTELSLESIGRDPFQRATLITDLVQTIQKIPDAIQRAVYTQEVAQLLSIDEQVLISEGNRQFQKQLEKPTRPLPSVLPENAPPVEKAAPLTEVQPISNALSLHESECVRWLVSYGGHVIERNVSENIEFTLADYYFQELRGMQFKTPLYQRMLNLIRGAYEEGSILPSQYFTSHPDPEIQQAAIHWMASPHELSEGWKNNDIHVPTTEEKLADLAYLNILRLKKARYESDFVSLGDSLNEKQTDEEVDQTLQQMKNLKEIIKKIADLLGTVVQH
ncbi:MAG: DNA primase [Spirosomataceae bacterium]